MWDIFVICFLAFTCGFHVAFAILNFIDRKIANGLFSLMWFAVMLVLLIIKIGGI
jgi:hypothetical protein